MRLILRLHARQSFDPIAVLAGHHAGQLRGTTVICATDGNHGRALAAAARSVGCACVIVLHAKVSVEREQAIAEYGATIVRIAGNYDDSVAEARRLAAARQWHLVSDTSFDGDEQVPCDVMQGYGGIVAEIEAQCVAMPDQACPFTHVFLQGGVGGLAAGIASGFWQVYGEHRPHFIVVEPEQADCLLQSARQGRAASTTGAVDSVMAGLACGDASPLAWRFLEPSVDLFMTVRDDGHAVAAMRLLAAGSAQDQPVVSGESGAAGLAGLTALRTMPAQAAACVLNAASRVLLISTEGATAPALYESLVLANRQTRCCVGSSSGSLHRRARSGGGADHPGAADRWRTRGRSGRVRGVGSAHGDTLETRFQACSKAPRRRTVKASQEGTSLLALLPL